MRTISSGLITGIVEEMCIKANTELGCDLVSALSAARNIEKSEIGRDILGQLIQNAQIAFSDNVPLCQDTGMAVFFVEIGSEVYIQGSNIKDAINEGVKKGYEKGCLRKSVVSDPILRQNTNDNTPAVIYYDFIDGDKLKIDFMPKGFGSENMSALKMLKPSDGIKGIKEFVLDTVKNAGANACPPFVIGIGIGGTMDMAAVISKKALLRTIGDRNHKIQLAKLEEALLVEINKLGIGPGGLGGTVTALAVNILDYPTHIAGLPVSVNICCHAARHRSCII